MNPLIGPPEVTECALDQMRERGGNWYAYQNHDLSSDKVGRLMFLNCGEGCTHTSPPPRMPDTKWGLGWRYVLVGCVDLESGDIRPFKADKPSQEERPVDYNPYPGDLTAEG